MTPQIIPFVDHEIGYRLLEKLITHAAANRIEIPAVVTTSENGNLWWPSVEGLCKDANIPLFLYKTPFRMDFFTQQPDWFLLLSWKHIIPSELINIPKQGVLNLHYSMLPAFRGVYPVNWAIMRGEHVTGFTYHFVNQKIDDGDIFMQIEVPVHLSDTARTLQLRLDNAVCDHFDELLKQLLSQNPNNHSQKQNNIKNPVLEYYSRTRFEEACSIDLGKNYQGIDFFNLLRGLTFFEDSDNAYIINSETGKKIFVTLKIREE